MGGGALAHRKREGGGNGAPSTSAVGWERWEGEEKADGGYDRKKGEVEQIQNGNGGG